MYFEFVGWILGFLAPLLGFALPAPAQPSAIERLSAEQIVQLEMQAHDVYMQDTENLTAEQVVDLEVQAQKAFEAAGGTY